MFGSKEKQVTFYPTYGYQLGDKWHIPLRIWVREPADFPLRMAASLIRRIIRNKAGLDALTEQQKALFKHRTEAFIADRESYEHVQFVFDADPEQTVFSLTNAEGRHTTDFNGLLEGVLQLSHTKVEQLLGGDSRDGTDSGGDGWLTLHAVSEGHVGVGLVRLIPATGLSVISDIDDTVKVTGFVQGSETVLRNTFFEDFVAAPGMAEMYRELSYDAVFHYVSGGPWQLFPPLAEFLFSPEVGYPLGSIHMKNVRTNLFESESYDDFWQLIAGGSGKMTIQQKHQQISTLLGHFPQRKFILIGDSGEHDPEIFRGIQAAFPAQIREIRIRDVAGDAAGDRLAGMTVIAV